MKHHLFVGLLLIFGLLFPVEVHRLRRSEERPPFRIISSKSFPCPTVSEMLTTANGGRSPRWIQLNDEDKTHLMHMRGQRFIMETSIREESLISDPLSPDQFLTSANTGSKSLLRSEMLSYLMNHRRSNQLASRSLSRLTGSCSLAEDVGLNQTTTDGKGFVVSIDKCCKRYSEVKVRSNYRRMCAECTTTIKTPADYWPSQLNGAICNSNDDKCLIENSTANGKCVKTTVPVQLLKQSTNSCVVLELKNEERVIAYDWKMEPYLLSNGCQCECLASSTRCQDGTTETPSK